MRFRFTIRDLLWLTALVAIGVGWWLDHRSIQRQFLAESNGLRAEFNSLRDDLLDVRQRLFRSRSGNNITLERPSPIPDVPAAKIPQ
jgi:hypothetical protein